MMRVRWLSSPFNTERLEPGSKRSRGQKAKAGPPRSTEAMPGMTCMGDVNEGRLYLFFDKE